MQLQAIRVALLRSPASRRQATIPKKKSRQKIRNHPASISSKFARVVASSTAPLLAGSPIVAISLPSAPGHASLSSVCATVSPASPVEVIGTLPMTPGSAFDGIQSIDSSSPRDSTASVEIKGTLPPSPEPTVVRPVISKQGSEISSPVVASTILNSKPGSEISSPVVASAILKSKQGSETSSPKDASIHLNSKQGFETSSPAAASTLLESSNTLLNSSVTQPLVASNTSMDPQIKSSQEIVQPSSSLNPPLSIPSSSGLSSEDKASRPNSKSPWASRFKTSLLNLKQMSPPSFMEDGTPVVVAPPSVILKSAEMWKGHIVAQFHGLCPPSQRIFTDLNPIWGRYGNITVRIISETAALIFIPASTTRQWVLDIGFWQAGNCSCSVYPWSAEGPLQLEKLQTAPTWAILRNVPPQLYSLEGISVIASGIGKSFHTEKSWLDPVNIGTTKVKVVINLNSPLPAAVVVRDVQGNTARVPVEYPRPPPKCLNCGKYGHLLSRCPSPLLKKLPFKKDLHVGSKVVNHPTVSLPQDKNSNGNLSLAQSALTSIAPSSSRKLSTDLIWQKKLVKPSGAATEVSRSEPQKRPGPSPKISEPKPKHQDSNPPTPSNASLVSMVPVTSPTISSPPAETDYPFPPDWDVLSSKAKKKLQKIWGLNNLARQRVVRNWVSSNGLRVGCFLETHVTEANSSAVLAATLPGWRLASNYCCSELGRIWLVWHPSVSVLIFMKTDQLIQCSIHLPNAPRSFAATFVYGRNSELERKTLWEDISWLASSSPLKFTPWILLGDFNQIASTSEHYSINHSNLSLRGIEDIQNCFSDNDLEDISSRGAFFTWSNHQEANPIIRKLDRVMANGEWLSSYPDALAIFDSPGESDHSPIMVILDNQPERGRKCFKYFSFLSTHPTFLSSLAVAWAEEILVGSAKFTLGERLNSAKKECKLLNHRGFGNIQQRTKDALSCLEEIQMDLLSNPSDALFRQEFVARKKWRFFDLALETFYRQKSRIRWLKEGDANTRFFHRAVIANQARNLISYLRGENDIRVVNVSQIKGMIIAYYSHLLGSVDSAVTPYSVDRIQDIQPFRCDATLTSNLSRIPSEEEIIQTLFSMPKNKAPGPDGFPAEFFWESWSIVKEVTVAAVMEFFKTGHLLPRFNATAIALIPKNHL
ncbi:uncharacterized protein LOC111830242 [Capsella rubella]|uniref:uncharacterized protein LOC111830242 n=1 Tax=Capsella rubella TaxID=81985 RepID=UPI000CD55AD1|nr:uncharacterized protein LOC111830242 [Capsella rubella]